MSVHPVYFIIIFLNLIIWGWIRYLTLNLNIKKNNNRFKKLLSNSFYDDFNTNAPGLLLVELNIMFIP